MFNAGSSRILSVCPFLPVLKRRSALLQGQGYTVVSYEKLECARSKIMMMPFRLCVLGHGFEVRQIRELVRWVRHKKIPVLLVYEGARPTNIHVDAFLPSSHDLDQLVRVVGWLAWK
jgi:hypothetical protein